MEYMLVTAETSHDPIGPCGPLEQWVDCFRHSLMAASSSPLDFGANTLVAVVVHIFPDEPENMPDLALALDFCHAPQSVLEKDFAP